MTPVSGISLPRISTIDVTPATVQWSSQGDANVADYAICLYATASVLAALQIMLFGNLVDALFFQSANSLPAE